MNTVIGKKRSNAQIIGEKGINVLRKLFPSEWVIREYTPDYGIDIAVEIFERYNENYITTGEHIYFQVKGTENINIGKYKVYERKNVEKELKQEKLYKEIDVVKFSIETSLLATVERMSSSVPVLLIVVDILKEQAYYVCLNDYIEKIIVPSKPNYVEQAEITVYIPIKNVIKEKKDVIPIEWYAKRAKLFALFNKANYQKEELKYFSDESLGEDIIHFAKIIRRFDAWSASKYFYALKIVENELDSLLKKGSTKWEENSLENLVQMGENIDEPCWNFNQSDTEMSLRDIEKIVGIRQLWDKLCNCGCILEDIGKEWFLPTYIGLITSYE